MSTITNLDLWSTANDGTWTPLRSWGTIINDNFTNLNTDKIESATTDTLTNKSVDLSTNTLTGTTAEFNTALSDGSFATGGWTATGTNTWDQTTVSWNAWTATALETARTINTVSFDGTANISVPSDITAWTSWNILTSNGTVWTSAAPASSGHTIEDEGTPLTTREALNFIWAWVTVTDNAWTNASDVTLNSPASDPSWVTWADAVTNIMSLTQAEYDAIGTPDASTIYNITDATAGWGWITMKEIDGQMSSWTFNLAHWLGETPSYIMLQWGQFNSTQFASWFYNVSDDDQGEVHQTSSGMWTSQTNQRWALSNTVTVTINSVDATNMNITVSSSFFQYMIISMV